MNKQDILKALYAGCKLYVRSGKTSSAVEHLNGCQTAVTYKSAFAAWVAVPHEHRDPAGVLDFVAIKPEYLVR